MSSNSFKQFLESLDMENPPLPQMSLFLVAASLLVALYVARTSIKKIYGPLAHLPGPEISKWTHWQLKIAVLKGDRVRYVHSLHEKYGPVVRIAPGEVSVADIAAAKQIYKVGGPYYKTEWYHAFTGAAAEKSLFSQTVPSIHGQHRRLTSNSFSEKWVKKMEPHISKNVQIAVLRMSQDMQSLGYCDVFKWFTLMATDVIGEAAFGESFGTLEKGEKSQYVLDLEDVASKGIVRSEFPELLALLAKLPFSPAKEFYRIIARMNSYAEESIQRHWKQVKEDPETAKATLLSKEYAAVDDGLMTVAQIRQDARGTIVAGTDTTAITATYAVYLLAHHPDVQQALIEEVSSLTPGFVDEDLRLLPLLGNVINETLRLFGPVGQGLPRYTPEYGAEFGGYQVPGKMVVGAQAYTMHRDPAIWSNPERFDPSRWTEPSKDMLHSFLPFGGGSRVCIGRYFAELELRHALANFYRTFGDGVRMAYVEGFTEQEMLPMGFFLGPPKGKRCLVAMRK